MMDYITIIRIDFLSLLLYNSTMNVIKKPEGSKGEKIIVLPRTCDLDEKHHGPFSGFTF